MQAGMNAYLTKPVVEQVLRQVLAEQLNGQVPGPENSTTPSAAGVPAEQATDFDLDKLVETFLGDKAFVKEYLIVTKNSLSATLNELEGHIKAQDFKAVKFAAHKLKGIAAYACLPNVHRLSAELEHIEQGDPQILTSIFGELRAAFNKAVILFDDVITKSDKYL